MKPSLRPPRTPSNLSDSVFHRLNMYALAASAAGVGLVALSQPADAKIVYTSTHSQITPNHTIAVNLNHDGKIDFNIKDTWFSTTSVGEDIVGSITVIPARGRPTRSWGTFRRTSSGVLPWLQGSRSGPRLRFRKAPKKWCPEDMTLEPPPWDGVMAHGRMCSIATSD